MNEQIELLARAFAHGAGIDFDRMGVVSKMRTLGAATNLIYQLRQIPEFEQRWTGE